MSNLGNAGFPSQLVDKIRIKYFSSQKNNFSFTVLTTLSCFKGSVVNRALPFSNEKPLNITITVS